MIPRLDGKVVLVSGAGSGIGRAAAVRLADEGAALVLVGRTARALLDTQAAIRTVRAEIRPTDVSDPASVESLAQEVLSRFGRLDILVNAAGINVTRRSLAEASDDDFQNVLNINLRGAFLLSRAFLPTMRSQGGGLIVHVGSDSSTRGNRFGGVAYIASKFGLRGLAEAINAEERQNGVRVTLILPGEVDTALLDKRPKPPPAEARRLMLQPEDVAECIALAVLLPPRALVEEVIIRPSTQDWGGHR